MVEDLDLEAIKLCTIWSAESLDEQGTPIRDERSVTYSAALESACALDTAAARSPFAQRVWREAARRRFCQAPRSVVLGDAPLWIWNIADDKFPDATQIVDRYHAKQHLSDLGKELYGPTNPRAAQWAERRKEELDTGKFRALLSAIRRQVSRSEEARRCRHYFQTNRERMRYPEFHAQSLCTSTGLVEAGWYFFIAVGLAPQQLFSGEGTQRMSGLFQKKKARTPRICPCLIYSAPLERVL